MALFATETWTMRNRLLLTIGAILVVCQLISVFWLWHESKEQIQLLVASAIEGHNNQKHVEHEVREAVASLLVPSLLIVGLALYISMLAVRKITRPLSRLQSELESRTPDNLTPIVLSESVPEVTAVTTALNQLVSRLNLTLDRERLFTADVAHELRTPLAGLRLHLELLAKVHGVGVDPLIQRLDQMTTSISQLLQLARVGQSFSAGSYQQVLQLARVGQSFSAGSYQQVLLLDDVVKPLQDELETMLAQRQQRLLLTDVESEAIVSGDATLIRVILRNLVENAHRYSPEGSTIRVSVKAGLMPVMAVEDEGPGIDEAKSGELSKAFVRMDSRYGGIGLGLSIVTRIAQLHDAQFFLHNRQPGPGVRAWVLFPRRAGQNVSTH
ncbi:TPA: two-component system sensor histidine kinase PmrB [Klebsiella variicola]|nr:two-component system sensor histidine kinase PmrB [Klebsiella variicola]